LSVISVGNALNGAAVLAGGNVTFTPAPNIHGTGSFEYNVKDGHGGTATGTVTVSIARNVPPYTAWYAIAETTSQGVVTGDMSLTADDIDDTYETIVEAQSGNRNFTWFLLTHQWQFNILQPGDNVTFCVEAHQVGNENYVFSYSLDGASYIDMLVLTKTVDDDQVQEYALPAGLTGTVYVRVTDSNTDKNEPGPADSILVDVLSIRCTASVPQASNPAPANGQTGVNPDALLSWTAGYGAVFHNVYFGADLANLQLASLQQTATTYDPSPTGALAENTT
jgi:hypothetical protein